MDPNQPGQTPQNDNYDFIMSAPTQNKSPLFAPENTKMRIIIFGAGIILLIVLMAVFFSFLNAAGSKQKENLLKIAQQQQQIIRLVDSSKENISSDNLKDKALTLRAVMVSSQQDVIAALAARGQKANPKDLDQAINPATAAELEDAKAQARHDEALDEIFQTLISEYSLYLQAVYDNGSPGEQELATEAYNQVDLIFNLSEKAGAEDAGQDAANQ